MKRTIFSLLVSCFFIGNCFSQENLPTDYLSKEFHAGRREALRKIMPAHSVVIVFAFPARTFSNDVSFPYHQNPDLYYFSGYKESNAVLLIFKETQTAPDHSGYNELFFIQRRDPQAEQWTGRRMGVENVKKQLGFEAVYEGAKFSDFPVDLSSFDKIIATTLPIDVPNDAGDNADLYDLMQAFKRKAALPADMDQEAEELISQFTKYVTPKNFPQFMEYFKKQITGNSKVNSNALIQEILNCKDSSGIEAIKQKVGAQKFSPVLYSQLVASLREIKTPEEMELMRKSVAISSIAHAEAMKAIAPGMSEFDLQGIQEYVHKKYGAEYVGYPSIVGAGDNGCILHYEENTKTNIGTDMVLMDVGAEYHGYSADVTRTVPSSGKFTADQKAIYNLVYEAQEEVFKLCKEGTPFSALNAKATEVLANGLIKLGIIKDKNDVRKYYPHGCSHFLGLDVHDAGNYNQKLKENMVITVEPGIYIPDNSPCDKKWWGIAVRIEDDVRVGKEQPELLSYLAPRKAEDVEKTVAEKSVLNEFVLPKLPDTKKGF